MYEEEITKPRLIEPGVKYFLNETLKQTHLFKMRHHNLFFNLGLLFLFLFILGIILFVKYKGRLTTLEREKKEQDKKQYILSKIKILQEAKKKAHQGLITGLPSF
jgi:cytoskeletal protein RodZ